MDKDSGEVLLQPSSFSNTKDGFDSLIQKLSSYSKDSILIGMEDTGHYYFALLKYLLEKNFTVALINPKTTDYTRKMQNGITKNDKLDTLTICDVLDLSLIHICEQPNPWNRLQLQDAMSRHRGAKPPRRCELLGEISLLSPG